jgi:thermopsin
MSRKFYDRLSGLRSKSSRRNTSLLIAFLLMFTGFLAFQLPHDSAALVGSSSLVTHQSVPLTQSLPLRNGEYDYFEADSFSNNTYISYNVSSDVSISTAIMTAAQLNDFENNASDPISNSLAYQNGTSIQNTVQIALGQNYLVFYYYNPYYSPHSRANIEFGYIVTPNTPLSYGPVQGPFASGIASFGIANNSGVVTPYEVQTNEIVGLANISAMQVYTPNASQYGVTVTGATLQLNSELVVNNSGEGTTQNVYWVQNVPDFETGPSQVSFGDEIWNWTDLTGYLSNQSVISTNFQNGGAVYPTGSSTAAYVYNYNGGNQTYALPLNFALLENETVLPGTGVLVQVGYLLTANGTTNSSTKTVWFDNVTIVDPYVQTAYFEVSGNAVPPIGLYYDTELVFGGEGNGEIADFTNLAANLGLFYQSSSNPSGILSSFPAYYGFSGDTGESASDLVVSYSNGISSVGTGLVPNYSYLGNASLTLNLQSLSSTTTSTTTTSTTTTTTTNQTSSSTTTSTSSSTTQSQTTSGSSTTTTSSPTTSASSSTSGNLNSNSSSSSSSSIFGQTTTTSSTTKENTGAIPATFEWTAAGIVIGVIIASLAFMALRRKPANGSPSV